MDALSGFLLDLYTVFAEPANNLSENPKAKAVLFPDYDHVLAPLLMT